MLWTVFCSLFSHNLAYSYFLEMIGHHFILAFNWEIFFEEEQEYAALV